MMSDFASSSPPDASIAICILGMHRSGTSAVTRVLNLLGMELGAKLMAAADDNSKGFWEKQDIVDCHTDLLNSIGSYFDDFFPLKEGWQTRPETAPFRQRLAAILKTEFSGKPLWGFKDPRACRLLTLWHELLAEAGAQSRFVIVARSPAEIAASLGRRGGQSANKSLLMTLAHLLDAERETRGRTRAVVTYDQLLADWRATAQRIATRLGINWPRPIDAAALEIERFLDTGMRHHHADEIESVDDLVNQLGADRRVAQWVMDVHALLTAAANNETGEVDQPAFDRINKEYAAAAGYLRGWRPPWSIDEKHLQMSYWAARMDSELQRFAGENQSMRMELARRPSAVEAAALILDAELRATNSEARVASANARAGHAAARAEQAKALAEQAERRAGAAEKSLRDMQQSMSWELTGPLRSAGKMWGKLLGKSAPGDGAKPPGGS
jgi:hypothetical protein